MEVTTHPRMMHQDVAFTAPTESSLSVSDEEQLILPDEDALDIEEDDLEFADDTRLRYQRLQARGRAAELAFNNRIQREREEAMAARSRAQSRSKSRSRPSTPILGALFKRDNFGIGITRSQSPPMPSTEKEKS